MAAASLSAIPPRIEKALKRAASATGADFDYLLKTAQRESAFKPTAKAKTSSAAGLFQFIEQTWLSTLKDAGPRHGLAKVSDAISISSTGKYKVADPAMRRAILALRFDPKLSALMAGEFTKANANVLKNNIGRVPSDGELYIGHFLGASNASKLINLAQNNPNGAAAPNFTRAARANKSIFYTASGAARSNRQVYANLTRHYDTQLTHLAQNNPKTPVAATGKDKNPAQMRAAGERADVRPLTHALFTIWQTPLDKAGESSGSAFHNLFSPGKTNGTGDTARHYRAARGRYLPTEAQMLTAFGQQSISGNKTGQTNPPQKTADAAVLKPKAANTRVSDLWGRKASHGGGILKNRNPGGI